MTGNKILVADDDIFILTSIVRGLTNAGYDVISANNGEEAVEVGCREQPDLAILDIRMPGLSGIDAARQLKAEAGIDSIFLSAYADREVVEQATKQGALGYLVKPVDTYQLIPAIEAALERSADLRRLQQSETNITDAILSNREISVAIGIYMERFHVTEEDAYVALRDFARSEQRKLVEVAHELVQDRGEKDGLINRIRAANQPDG